MWLVAFMVAMSLLVAVAATLVDIFLEAERTDAAPAYLTQSMHEEIHEKENTGGYPDHPGQKIFSHVNSSTMSSEPHPTRRQH